MRRLGVTALLVLALVPGAIAGSSAVRPLLGIAGDPARFEEQTGQTSIIRSIFLAWGQGQTFGSRFARLFEEFGPIPMLHLGTGGGGRVRREVITPLKIARGVGDSYLFALNGAIFEWKKLIYVRPMAEMNNPKTFYSYERKKDAAHSPAAYKLAFCRIHLLLHGGSAAELTARLRMLGLPGVGQDFAVNRYPMLRTIWNPVAGQGGHEKYYPGDRCTDMVGNDIYTLGSMAAMEKLYNDHRRKKFSIPEWGLERGDEPEFIEAICKFIKTHPRNELAAYYEAKPGSSYDLGNKPMSRAVYRRCITPLGGAVPG